MKKLLTMLSASLMVLALCLPASADTGSLSNSEFNNICFAHSSDCRTMTQGKVAELCSCTGHKIATWYGGSGGEHHAIEYNGGVRIVYLLNTHNRWKAQSGLR